MSSKLCSKCGLFNVKPGNSFCQDCKIEEQESNQNAMNALHCKTCESCNELQEIRKNAMQSKVCESCNKITHLGFNKCQVCCEEIWQREQRAQYFSLHSAANNYYSKRRNNQTNCEQLWQEALLKLYVAPLQTHYYKQK